jgi:hypothetical protein
MTDEACKGDEPIVLNARPVADDILGAQFPNRECHSHQGLGVGLSCRLNVLFITSPA